MACFLVPAGEAIMAFVAQRILGPERTEQLKLGWLNVMLWGGVIVLAMEHIWHGEVVPWPPFLTAMSNPADVGPMLLEIATVGVSMAVLITAIWGVMVLVSNRIERKTKKLACAEATEG